MNSFARCLVKMQSKDYRMEINMSRNYRDDFPLIKNNDRIYIDNAATSQKPECVIKAEAEFYEKNNAIIHLLLLVAAKKVQKHIWL